MHGFVSGTRRRPRPRVRAAGWRREERAATPGLAGGSARPRFSLPGSALSRSRSALRLPGSPRLHAAAPPSRTKLHRTSSWAARGARAGSEAFPPRTRGPLGWVRHPTPPLAELPPPAPVPAAFKVPAAPPSRGPPETKTNGDDALLLTRCPPALSPNSPSALGALVQTVFRGFSRDGRRAFLPPGVGRRAERRAERRPPGRLVLR